MSTVPMRRYLAFMPALAILLSADLFAVTVCKDGSCDHTSIAEALYDSDHYGEDVIVHPGVYLESNLIVGGTAQGSRTLMTSLEPDNPSGTVIDATGSGQEVIERLYSNMRLVGFTLRGGHGGIGSVYPNVVLENMVIEDNHKDNDSGGGVRAPGGPLTIINSVIRNNSARSGGGVTFNSSSVLTIIGSRIEGNLAHGAGSNHCGGGGINAGGLLIEIRDSEIVGNRANRPAGSACSGAGLWTGSETRLTNVLVQGNVVVDNTDNESGGGIHKTRGAGYPTGTRLVINGGAVTGNSADRGGGIQLSSDSILIMNGASVTQNTARGGVAGSGGGIWCAENRAENVNVTWGAVTDNQPDNISCMPGDIMISGPQPDSRANKVSSGSTGDPVNTFTGELYQEFEPDLDLGGPMPLQFSRYYASGLSTANVGGRLGTNWLHNHEWKLSRLGDRVTVVDHVGRVSNFEESGNKWILSGRTDLVFQLAEQAGLYTLWDPRAQKAMQFDGNGYLIKISDGAGNEHALAYDDLGRLQTVSDGLGRVLTYGYNESHRLTSVSDGLRSVNLAFDGDDLASFTDAGGNQTLYQYDPGGLMTGSQSPLGNVPLSQSWDAEGRVGSQSDSTGNTLTLDYAGPVTQVTDALVRTRTHLHSASGELEQDDDPAGQILAFVSDPHGRRSEITDRSGNTRVVKFDLNGGQLLSSLMPNGAATSFTYEIRVQDGVEHRDLISMRWPDGGSEAWSYDAEGNVVSHTDRLGYTAQHEYNEQGQRTRSITKLGGEINRSYLLNGMLESVTDASGNVTTMEYDSLGRLQSVVQADGTTRQFSWDNNDRLLGETDERGHQTSMEYDANGRLQRVTDAGGHETLMVYDGDDRLVQLIEAEGGQQSFGYDELGRLESTTDANGNFVSLAYNDQGYVEALVDGEGGVWQRDYNPDGYPVSVSDPLGNTSQFERDAMHRITRVIDPLENVEEMEYDIMGKVIRAVDAMGRISLFDYDLAGRAIRMQVPLEIETSFERNAKGQIVRVNDGNGENWHQTYDSAGRLISKTDPVGNTTGFHYDKRNRVSGITYPDNMGSLTLTYDEAGNVLRRVYSDGTDIGYVYDPVGRMTQANGITRGYSPNGHLSESNGIGIEWDPGGRMSAVALADGKAVSYTYNSNDQVVEVNDWTGNTTRLVYDAAGRMVEIIHANQIRTRKEWDAASQIIGIRIDKDGADLAEIALVRDARGNVTSASRTLPATGSSVGRSSRSYGYDSASRLSGRAYDALGQLIADGSDIYDWNLAHQLAAFTRAGVTISAEYDALGRRISRTESGTTSSFVWNEGLALVSVSIEREAGVDRLYHVHLPDGALLYSIDAATEAASHYHFDESGNTVFITDGTGATLAAYAWSPYGELLSKEGNHPSRFTWQGQFGVMQEQDGLYYMRARYYDSRSGRFLTRDSETSLHPIRFNPYQYASQNPLRYFDPWGTNEQNPTEGFVGSRADNFLTNAGTALGLGAWALENGADRFAETLEAGAVAVASSNTRLPAAYKKKLLDSHHGKIKKLRKFAKRTKYAGAIAGTAISLGRQYTESSVRRAEGSRNHKSALDIYNAQVDEVMEAYRNKRITLEEAERLLWVMREAFDEAVAGAYRVEWTSHWIAALESIKELGKEILNENSSGFAGDLYDQLFTVIGKTGWFVWVD